MQTGIYTSDIRVEREGRLVAFAGEVMTMTEAQERGLLDEAGEPKKGKKSGKEQLVAEAAELGVSLPARATIAQIESLLEDAKAQGLGGDAKADADSGDQEGDSDAEADADSDGQDGDGEADADNEPV